MRSERIILMSAFVVMALIAITTAASALVIQSDSLVTVPSSGWNGEYTVFGTGIMLNAEVWVRSPAGVTYSVQEHAWSMMGTSVRGHLAIPASAAPGSYTVFVRNPGFGTASMANAFIKIAQPQLKADLRAWTFAPPSGPQPRTFNILNAVKNTGLRATGPFQVGFYLSKDTTFTTADIRIGTRYHYGLPAGVASPNLNTLCSIPDSVPAGEYYLGMIIDPTRVVDESNEANNVFYDVDKIIIQDTRADLRAWTFAPPSGPQPRTFNILNAVKNTGLRATGPFQVGFYLSKDTTFTTADIRIGTRYHYGLPAGVASPNLNTLCSIPPWVPAGPYYLGMIIDPTRVVDESNEANNVFYDVDRILIA